jgi:LacI family transcriptional regulator
MPTPLRRVTLRDIARVAGCHFTTVSLALRNHHGLPRETCERLQALATKLGYVPDPMLASFSSYRSALGPVGFRATLGWVTNYPGRNGWRQKKIFEDYFAGAEERALSLGYKLEEFWLREPGMTPARATQILRARGITGLIVAPQPEPAMSVDLEWSQFSAVAIGYSLVKPSLHLVCVNQYRAMRHAMDELAAAGYRRPGMMMLQASDDRVDHNWTAGFLVGQRALPAAGRVPPLLLTTWDEDRFRAWLARYRPDVVITKCEETLPALRRLKKSVPRDLGVAFLTYVEPGGERSGINENPRLVGAAAVEYLTAMIHRNERGVPIQPQQLLINASWVPGCMLRRPPGAP